MSEKIKLKNGQEFDLIPNGIVTDEAKQRRYFKFTSELAYTDILAALSNTANLMQVDYIAEDGTTARTYADCTALKSLNYVLEYQIDDNTTANIYVAEISTDPVERAMQGLNCQIDDLANTIVIISMM